MLEHCGCHVTVAERDDDTAADSVAFAYPDSYHSLDNSGRSVFRTSGRSVDYCNMSLA